MPMKRVQRDIQRAIADRHDRLEHALADSKPQRGDHDLALLLALRPPEVFGGSQVDFVLEKRTLEILAARDALFPG
jgi:hypothetical protein